MDTKVKPAAIASQSSVSESAATVESTEDATVSVQNVSDDDDVPEPGQFRLWITSTLSALKRPLQHITIRLVRDDEIRQLNRTYRNRDKVTNVLSFPFEAPPGLNVAEHDELNILGDIVISPAQTKREADAEAKSSLAHFAHLSVHAVLHLHGYDHETDADAAQMQRLESHLLTQLGYPDPWSGGEFSGPDGIAVEYLTVERRP